MIKEHTRLINKVIGLSYGDEGWPSTLYDLGYRTKLVEPTITTSDEEPARPDVILVSNRIHHILVVECKSGDSLSLRQDTKYGKLKTRSIAKDIGAASFIDKHTVLYAINESNHGQIEKQTGRPLIVFSPTHIQGFRKSGVAKLDAEICAAISLENMTAPTNYYPFGPDEENYEIAVRVVQSMLSLAMRGKRARRPNGDDIVDVVFDQTHIYQKIIPGSHIKLIKNKIKRVIDKDPDLKKEIIEHVVAIQKGTDPGAQRKFVTFYRRYLEKTAAQKTLDEVLSAGH